jgi:D-3-phosphoglycerate dehydrogenase
LLLYISPRPQQAKKAKLTTRILLTTTSYQDTPGKHHDLLKASGFEVVRARGPLKKDKMLELIKENGGFDGLLNGDDEIDEEVLKAAQSAERPLKVVAKYGIGLDSIDVKYCTSQKIPVLFTPGVNHTTVAEHAFGLMVACSKHFWMHMNAVKTGNWKRKTGIELAGKTLGIMGLGRIGREVAIRAKAFGMNVVGFDLWWPEEFAKEHKIQRMETGDEVVKVRIHHKRDCIFIFSVAFSADPPETHYRCTIFLGG